MKNILVPIGTSPDAFETLQYAVNFAAEFSAQVYVMDVFTFSGTTGSLANITEKIEKSRKERLKEVIDKVDSFNVNIKIASFNGELIDGIKTIDKELGIDLIILAPRSNDVNEALFLGKTSGKIIKRTDDIPTLIVSKGTEAKTIKKYISGI